MKRNTRDDEGGNNEGNSKGDKEGNKEGSNEGVTTMKGEKYIVVCYNCGRL